VIGAGLTGLYAAWRLALLGREVMVLEQSAVAAGASGGPGRRGVRANGRDRRELPLMARAYRLWPDLADETGHPTGYQRTGQLHLTEHPEDMGALGAQAGAQAAAGVPSVVVEGPGLRHLEPELSDRVVAAVHCPLDGVADHTATTRGLAAAARRAGAELREGVGVGELRWSRDRIGAVTGEGDVVEAGTAVVAANAGAQALLASGGIVLPVFPVFPQVLVSPPLERTCVRHLIGHAHRRLALKTLPGGEVMITGGWLGRWDADEKGGVVVPDAVAGNLADAAAVFPSLAGVEVALAVADRAEAVSRDLVPIIDRVPGADNAFFATGWSGHGWAIGPVVAELLVEWVTTGRRPPLLAPFALERFSAASGA